VESKPLDTKQAESARERDASAALDRRIEALLAEPVAGLGCRLLEARLRQEGRWVLRLTIDRPATETDPSRALTLDDCAQVSELAGRILDVEDPVPHAFFLEVSSPGLFRPLRERRHFEQSIGKTIRLTIAPDILPERKDRTFRARVKALEGEVLSSKRTVSPWPYPSRR